MTAIDVSFIERNLQEESFRQKDNREKPPVLPWKAIKESSFTEQTCETPERIKEKAAPFEHDQSSNFFVLWQLQAHSEITLKRYYLLSAQKMMMGMWSAVLVAGSCNGYSILRQIFKSLPSWILSPQFATFRHFLSPASSPILFQSFSAQAFRKLDLIHTAKLKSLRSWVDLGQLWPESNIWGMLLFFYHG